METVERYGDSIRIGEAHSGGALVGGVFGAMSDALQDHTADQTI